jgi:hypothetical protein
VCKISSYFFIQSYQKERDRARSKALLSGYTYNRNTMIIDKRRVFF